MSSVNLYVARGLLLSLVSLLVACGSDTPSEASDAERQARGTSADTENMAAPALTAATLGEQTVKTANEWLADAPYASADRQNGERQASFCRACHSLDEGGPNMIGPGLHGFFGRKAGAVDGFAFSEAVAATNFVWTPRALDAWLAEPAEFLPGNRMTFVGIRGESDRNDLIAYLLEVTAAEMNE